MVNGIMRADRRILGCTILALSMIAGCAPVTQQPLLFWPPPPEQPRIAYVRSYSGEGDLRKTSFLDSLLGAPPARGMSKPYGVSAQQGRIYVADSRGASVVVFDEKARSVGYLGDTVQGRLSLPIDVAVASDGSAFVSDAQLKRVFRYDASGRLKTAIGNKEDFTNPAGIALNEELGRLYVVDSVGHSVRVYSMNGEFLFRFGANGGGDGKFNFPSNIAIDRRNGNIWIADTMNFRVQLFDKDGKFLRKFGYAGDVPGSFSRPKGIGVDSEGHVYVADAAFNNVQIFDENGRLLLFFGGPGNGRAEFWSPAGLYIDPKDRIYVVDALRAKVEIFQYLSEQWRKEHPEEYKKYLPAGSR